jgi:hypothetical protein
MPLAAILSQCDPQAVSAQNQPVSGLVARGTPVPTDQLPILPAGSASLKASYASDVRNYVLTSLNGFAGVDPTGTSDSTAGIQAAINTGQSLSCNGVYKISTGITLETSASHGQIITGSGSTSSLGTPTANKCVFRPTNAFSGFVFTIDGTPVSTLRNPLVSRNSNQNNDLRESGSRHKPLN